MNEPKTIQLLWDYMVYADRLELAATESLSDAGYYREQGFAAGSVHALVMHCMNAQRMWLERIQQTGNPPPIDPASVKRDQVGALWAAVHADLLAFAAKQTPASLETVIQSVNRAGIAFELPVGMCMLHISDHATYHRGQLNSMIKLAAGVPSPVMLFSYGLEKGFGKTR